MQCPWYTSQGHSISAWDDTDGTGNTNAWILASALWDIVKGGLPAGGGTGSWPVNVNPDSTDPNHFDGILWDTLNHRIPKTLEEFHNDMEVEARNVWGSDYRADRTHDACIEHGIGTPGTPLPAPALLSPGADAPVVEASPNYPNPYNPETWIPFTLNRATDVTITIYDTRGNVVRILDLGELDPGDYSGREAAAYWNGRSPTGEGVAGGVYLYELRAGSETVTGKMLLAK